MNLRVVFGRRIDVCSDARDRAFSRIEPCDTEVSNLHDLPILGEQQVLWFDIAMNDAALVGVRETGTDLFEVEQRALDRERARSRERKHVAAGQVFEDDV